jgi:hypothetical protein
VPTVTRPGSGHAPSSYGGCKTRATMHRQSEHVFGFVNAGSSLSDDRQRSERVYERPREGATQVIPTARQTIPECDVPHPSRYRFLPPVQ